MCSRKNAVGIGLIKPKISLATLSCKLCIGNIRAKTKKGKIIGIQEGSVSIEHGRRWKGKEICTEKPTIWQGKASIMFSERPLEITNDEINNEKR